VVMLYKITIGVSKTKGLFEWLIRKVTKSVVNHAFIIYQSSTWQSDWAVQVDTKGVRLLPVSKVLHKAKAYKLYVAKGIDLSVGLRESQGLIGLQYDYMGVLGFLVYLWRKRFSFKAARNVLHRKDAMFCSEFVATVLRNAGAPGAEDLIPSCTSPRDIMEYLDHEPDLYQCVVTDGELK